MLVLNLGGALEVMSNKLNSKLVISTLLTGSLLISLPSMVMAISQDKLIVTSSFYQGTATPIVAGSTILAGKTAGSTVTATADGSYLNVWNNNKTDGSFGITSPVFISFLDSEYGNLQQTINLSDIAARQGYKFVTSFSSKSELAVNLSTDGKSLTLMGYGTTQGQIDISNSNTPDVIDPTNPTVGIAAPTYRNVAQINPDGSLTVTSTDGYSGNNGRAAILDATTNTYFMVGNAGNSGTGPTNATLATLSGNTGVQTIAAGNNSPLTKVIGQPQGTNGNATGYQFGFSVTQINPLTGSPYAAAADKTGKDDNFRGMTVFNKTLYVTKGSGGNGIDTVYQVGATGSLDSLVTNSSSTPITILPGLPSVLASGTPTNFPFGIWFANDHTLYVADEGDGVLANAGKSANAGLEKWVLSDTDHLWHNVYTLQAGLNLGVNYTVSGSALGVSGSYTTATDGLRNLIGRDNLDGTVTLFATTSTVSTSGDQGADPNKLVKITDVVGAVTAPTNISFDTLQTAQYGQVLRGVALVDNSFMSTVTNPSISLNGSSVTVQLTSGSNIGKSGDWWFLAYTPWGHWFAYIYPNQWVDIGTSINGAKPAYQGPLADISGLALFNTTGLASGSYDLYFGVDTNMNGVLDTNQLYYSHFPLIMP